MKTAIKFSAIAALLATIGAITAFAQPQAQAPAKAQAQGSVTEQRQVAAFSAIELSGPYRVRIDAHARQAVELAGERKQLDGIEVLVRGDTLVVRPLERQGFHFSFGFRTRREVPTIVIGAAGLKSLKSGGNGEVELEQVGGERFTLASSGPGDLHASGTVRQLTVDSSGSGDLDLRDLKATAAEVELHGPGGLRLAGIGAPGPQTQPKPPLNPPLNPPLKPHLSLDLSGSGDLVAEGLRLASLKVRLNGPGNAKLSGSSRELRLESSGSGDFEGCELAVEAVRSVQHGPGNACIAGTIRSFDAEVDGSGGLVARGLQAGSGSLRLGGPGEAELSGSIGDLGVDASGSGDLKGDGLKVRKAVVRSHGPGGVALQNVADTLDADISGSGELKASLSARRLLLRMNGPGDAHLDGSVAELSAQLSGSGNLEGRHLSVGSSDITVRGPGTARVNLVGKEGMAKNGAGTRGKLLLVDRSGTRQVAN